MAVDENFNFVYPPTNVPANTIGPVHLNDAIELSWTPRTLEISPPYKLQMACRLADKSYIFEPITNITTPHVWVFKQNYDSTQYSCWWGFMVPSGGTGQTGASFSVLPSAAATAMTFRASATSATSVSSSSSTTSSSSSSATSASSQTTTTTPIAAVDNAAPTVTTTVTALPSDNGLSTGAKAGIGIGATAGAIILICLVLGIFFFRKRKTQASESTGPDLAKGYYDKPSLAFVEAEAPYPYAEADSQELRHEMHA